MERHITIKHEDLQLAGTIHYPEGVCSAGKQGQEGFRVPLVVICHGFVGNRIGVDRLFVKTARELALAGNLVLRFDYGGCGESSGEYGDLGLESMIAQTRTALDYALDCCDVDLSRVTLLGHSLGGAVALLTAVKDRRVKRLVMWSAVGYPFNDIVKIIGRSGYDESKLKGKTDYAGYSFTPKYFDSLGLYQPFQETNRFAGDVLLIHGTSDDVIPVDYSFLYEKTFWLRSDGRCDKEIIFQADHTYSTGTHQTQVIGKTKMWLRALEERQSDWQHWSI
ncbi:alpha/beta hydrolase [Paenibacillus guangzhouensis]|uniref:alpha/beta hydrolase n=1 Tax=Paenibacillus guangzhouensis TaxID=1473112 RepID=UPI0012676E47|nr:alpha/beta fold hydrolase [Paenibacillus guangzhouensis]